MLTRERAVTFGSHGGLVGIISEPSNREPGAGIGVLLFNVGLNHRVGPSRFNVELARHLATRGIVTLRFDLSGLGDSAPRPDVRSYEERALLDLQEAMDLLTQKKRVTDFVVVGFCSGVDSAHALTVSDPRVKGAVFIDGYAYPTRRYYWIRAKRRAARWLSSEAYGPLKRRITRILTGRSSILDFEGRPEIFDRTYPTLSQFRDDLEEICGQRRPLLFMYTRNALFYNYRAQFVEMLNWDTLPEQIEVEYWPEADHLLTAKVDRLRVIQRIGGWLARRFYGDAVAPAHMSISA